MADEPKASRPQEDRTRRRIATGASATMSNVGPEHAGVPDAEEFDAVEGTTSGRQGSAPRRGFHEKPIRGSRESGDL